MRRLNMSRSPKIAQPSHFSNQSYHCGRLVHQPGNNPIGARMAMQISAAVILPRSKSTSLYSSSPTVNEVRGGILPVPPKRNLIGLVCCSSGAGGGGDGQGGKKKGVPNSNYVVPLDKSFSPLSSSCITRPLVEILRDLNKRIPDNIIKTHHPRFSSSSTFVPWYHANRMLSFYAPGWCGEVRDVIFSDNGSVTVVYRLTIRGSDGEAHRESTGTISPSDGHEDPVAAAEEIAFCRACARFGLGLYLYHEE